MATSDRYNLKKPPNSIGEANKTIACENND